MSLLLNIPVKSYGHVVTNASDFVGRLLDIEMNDTPSPAIKHHLSKQLRLQGQTDISLILGRLRPSKLLTSTQVFSQFAALRGGSL